MEHLKKAKPAIEKGSITRGRAIPREYQEELRNIHALLYAFENRYKTRLPLVLVPSPPLRHRKWCLPLESLSLLTYFRISDFKVRYRDTVNWGKNDILVQPPKGDDAFLRILMVLLKDDEVHRWSRTRLYDQLDTITSKSPEQRGRISQLLSSLLARMGSIGDALAIIDRHRPQLDSESLEELQVRFDKITKELMSGLRNSDGMTLPVGESAYPTAKYLYPKGQKVRIFLFFVFTNHDWWLDRAMGTRV